MLCSTLLYYSCYILLILLARSLPPPVGPLYSVCAEESRSFFFFPNGTKSKQEHTAICPPNEFSKLLAFFFCHTREWTDDDNENATISRHSAILCCIASSLRCSKQEGCVRNNILSDSSREINRRSCITSCSLAVYMLHDLVLRTDRLGSIL